MTTYLITGGAGSLGRELVSTLLEKDTISTVRILDIDEGGMADMKYPRIRCLYGDIRDPDRVRLAMRGVDVCIHTAAMKNLDIAEYNVTELIKTNVIGTQNVVHAALDQKIGKLIYISSDKAVHPTTTYGTTKLLGEKIVSWAGLTNKDIAFTTVRPGNFWRSKGNVFEVWEKQHQRGWPLTLTDKNMIRYFIDTKELSELIFTIAANYELYRSSTVIPKMKRYVIEEELRIRYPKDRVRITGMRIGEKLMEKLWADHEKVEGTAVNWVIRWET